MSGALKKLKSLKGRSLDELRVRGAQQLAAAAERAGLSPQVRTLSDKAFFRLLYNKGRTDLRSAEGLLNHFRTRTSPSFFPSFDNPDETVGELKRRFGKASLERTVEEAEKILAGRFDLLGFRDLSFGDPIDWHLEPVAGRRAPLRHWSRINYLDSEVTGDKRLIWELNRQHYFTTLGRAYWQTGDERYAKAFAEHLSDWMEKNPPKQGINWTSSLEVAFRSMSWLWALHFFRHSEQLTPPLFLRALKFLYLNARHLETYLSTYFSPNTHLTGEALGLFYIGTLMPEFRRAERWRTLGHSILIKELDRHVISDGVYFERTTYYHRYTTDFYAHLYILCEANGERAHPQLAAKLQALVEHLVYITKPDGMTPLFGDDDGGRFLSLEEREVRDFRATISTGAVLFGRGDYKWVAEELAEESLWLLGLEGARRFDRLEAEEPHETSRSFPEGGYHVMRDGWGRDANYLMVDCGPHGTLNCGHAHADALSFELAARGRTLLIDTGTYTYTGSKEARDYFRSSLAHNTLTVDGESSSVPDGPFSWKQITDARLRTFISARQFDLFEGEHDGYRRLPQPVTHRRSILFIKHRYWIMRDLLESEGEHNCELRFHYAPGARPSIEEGAGVLRERAGDRAGLDIYALGRGGRWREEEAWVSERYGSRTLAPLRIFSVNTGAEREILTFLIPAAANKEAARVREVEATGGRAAEILEADARSLLLIRAAERVAAQALASDFDWTWARFEAQSESISELVLVGGSSLRLNAEEVVKAEGTFGFLAARREDDELIVETDASVPLRLAHMGARRVIVNGKAFDAGKEVNLSEPLSNEKASAKVLV